MKKPFALLGLVLLLAAGCGGDDDDDSGLVDGGVPGPGNSDGDGGSQPVDSACVDSVQARGAHTCALADDGQVLCWGRNNRGQLGDGTTQDSNLPVQVDFDSGIDVDAVVTGVAHSCALAGGRVYCWGYNGDGAIGNGSRDDVSVPTRVQGIDDATTIVSGGFHTCVLRPNDSLWCWGDNVSGQIGDGNQGDADRLTPVQVATNVAAAAAGEEHTCVISTSGDVQCWGRNQEGQLGDGSTTLRPTAVDVQEAGGGTLSGADKIFAGDYHTCVITSGTVQCWGRNSEGQVTGAAGGNVLNPAPVAGVTGVDSGGGGEQHTCVLGTDGRVRCWGQNASGQLGQGDVATHDGPVVVQNLSGVDQLGVGDLHNCAVIDGSVECWGYNANGQLGDGTVSQAEDPVPVALTCQ